MVLARPRIAVFFLGGTIAMAQAKNGSGARPTLKPADLLSAQTTQDLRIFDLIVHDVAATASANLDLAQVQSLATQLQAAFKAGVSGAVVVQGTDTLEEVAYALDLLVSAGPPLVVTGAMRRPDQPGADGPANLLAAIRTAASPRARNHGVLVVLNDEIHAGRWARKHHTVNTAAFSSWPHGPLGTVVEGKVRLPYAPVRKRRKMRLSNSAPVVPIVQLGLGTSPAELSWLDAPSISGLVVAALGGGHAPASCAALLQAVAESIPVVLASRVTSGEVLTSTYGYPGGEIDLISRGLIPAGRLDPAKARVLLQILLSNGADSDAIRAAFCDRE